MQGLMQQAREIVELAATMNAAPAPCASCTRLGYPCFWHGGVAPLIRKRRMTRAQWLALQHDLRERTRERELQDRDMEDWRETEGRPMPYSVQVARGYAE